MRTVRILCYVCLMSNIYSCSLSDDVVKTDPLLDATNWISHMWGNIPRLSNPETPLTSLDGLFPTLSYTIDEQTSRDTIIYDIGIHSQNTSSLTFDDIIEWECTRRYKAFQCTFVEQVCYNFRGGLLTVKSNGAYSCEPDSEYFDPQLHTKLSLHNFKYNHCTLIDTLELKKIEKEKIHKSEQLSFTREGNKVVMENQNLKLIGTIENVGSETEGYVLMNLEQTYPEKKSLGCYIAMNELHEANFESLKDYQRFPINDAVMRKKD